MITDAQITVRHDDLTTEQSAVALVEWITRQATEIYVDVTDLNTGTVTTVEVVVATLAASVQEKRVPVPIFWIVDTQGATFAYSDEALARAAADREKRNDAVNLVLFPTAVPADIAEQGPGAVAEWAASNAAPDERAEYLTGNAPDIEAQDAEDEARASGPITHTVTVTPEAAAFLAASQVFYATTETEDVVREMLTRDDASSDEIAEAAVSTWVGSGLRTLLVHEAAGLLDVDDLDHETQMLREYTRGMAELIMRATGGISDDVLDLTNEIRAEVRSQHAGLLSERAARKARGDEHYQG